MGKTSRAPSAKPPPSAAGSPGGKRFLSLVEAEIIPRLIHAHRTRGDAPGSDAAIAQGDVDLFAQMLLDPSRDPAEALLERHCERGVPLDVIYLELFTPAARLLGDMWLVDTCSFSQVTLGLWRIRGMIHELSPSFHVSAGDIRPQRAAERRILMVSLSGQQHTLGLSLLSEFFRRDGWIALCIPSPEPGLTQSTLSSHWFDVLGLSASMDSEVADLEKTIKAARKTSQNPRLTGGTQDFAKPAPYCTGRRTAVAAPARTVRHDRRRRHGSRCAHRADPRRQTRSDPAGSPTKLR